MTSPADDQERTQGMKDLDSTPANAQEEGLRAATYEDGYSQGQADAVAEHKWVHDKAWMDAVLMFNHYDRLAAMTWLVGADDAAAKRDEWRRNISSLAGTKSVEDINALAAWNRRVPVEGEGSEGREARRWRGMFSESHAKLEHAVKINADWVSENERLKAEVASLRRSLGQIDESSEPVGCPTPGACSCLARPDPSVPAAPAASAPEGEHSDLDTYDVGLLGDGGGGDVSWWHDYMRAELDRAGDFYQTQHEASHTAQAERIREMEERADLAEMERDGLVALHDSAVDDLKAAWAERDALKSAAAEIVFRAQALLSVYRAKYIRPGRGGLRADTPLVREMGELRIAADALAALTTPSKETGR